MHEESEEEQEVDQLRWLKFGDDVTDKPRNKLGNSGADGVDKLGKGEAGLHG
jgi:hypothetical protein